MAAKPYSLIIVRSCLGHASHPLLEYTGHVLLPTRSKEQAIFFPPSIRFAEQDWSVIWNFSLLLMMLCTFCDYIITIHTQEHLIPHCTLINMARRGRQWSREEERVNIQFSIFSSMTKVASINYIFTCNNVFCDNDRYENYQLWFQRDMKHKKWGHVLSAAVSNGQQAPSL